MNEQQEKLLAVLDMSKDEQMKWIAETFVPKYGYRINLADLAFRLRDEVMESPGFYSAMLDIHQHVEGSQNRAQDYVFWSMRAKPIHWIIATLIAKESR